jgi:hypothetical protein
MTHHGATKVAAESLTGQISHCRLATMRCENKKKMLYGSKIFKASKTNMLQGSCNVE